MFHIGTTEILIIIAVALLLLGPKKIPEIAKTLGQLMRSLRRASDDLRDEIEREADSPGDKEILDMAPKENIPLKSGIAQDEPTEPYSNINETRTEDTEKKE